MLRFQDERQQGAADLARIAQGRRPARRIRALDADVTTTELGLAQAQDPLEQRREIDERAADPAACREAPKVPDDIADFATVSFQRPELVRRLRVGRRLEQRSILSVTVPRRLLTSWTTPETRWPSARTFAASTSSPLATSSVAVWRSTVAASTECLRASDAWVAYMSRSCRSMPGSTVVPGGSDSPSTPSAPSVSASNRP